MADRELPDNPADRPVPDERFVPIPSGLTVRRVLMLIGPVLALLLFVLFYKRDVNPAGTVWVPPALRHPNLVPPSPWQPPAVPQAFPARPPAEPMDLNDVFRRRA
jgi:hypothetical protein